MHWFEYIHCGTINIYQGTIQKSARSVLVADSGEPVIMKRNETLRLLKAHKAEIQKRFDVTSLALFGSTSRDSAGSQSDIDILVVFDGPATSSRYFGLQFYLEDLFGKPIDLVTDKALRPELRPYVEQEAVHV